MDFNNMTITTGTVSDGSVAILGLYGSASKSGFIWDEPVKFNYVAGSQSVSTTALSPIKILVLGDNA
jgi:hypothetical protein